MQFGAFLFLERKRERIKKIQRYTRVSWDELIQSNTNRLTSEDSGGVHYEGEIDTIQLEGDRIIVRCKWMRAKEPVFDEDGDIDSSQMSWVPWEVVETFFTTDTKLYKCPNSDAFVIESHLDDFNFTLTRFSESSKFKSFQ